MPRKKSAPSREEGVLRLITNPIGDVPSCPHGPTLLFERSFQEKSKSTKKFFACAAYRDRAGCPFYQIFGSKNKSPDDAVPKIKQTPNSEKLLVQILQAPSSDRNFCVKCGKLFLSSHKTKHDDHKEIKKNLTNIQICRPSKLLTPLNKNKQEAQFHFSRETVKFVGNTLQSLNLNRVICLGTSSIHEHVQNHKWKGSDSMLLDIDTRLRQFYDRSSFALFNMFNFHFFEDDGLRQFSRFIKKSSSDQLVLVIDPPFGGLMEALNSTIQRMNEVIRKYHREALDIKIILFMPYYLEHKIVSNIPGLLMSDYQVQYLNHRKLASKMTSNKPGSVVRIFTNLPLEKLKLPEEDGYKFCVKCAKYISHLNRHCEKCDACTSKDGRPSVHCDKCNRCFKDTWRHCDNCERCAQPHSH